MTAKMAFPRRIKRLFAGGSSLEEQKSSLSFVSVAEAPKLDLNDVETRMNMGQFNGLFRDHTTPERLPNVLQKMQSSPVLASGRLLPLLSEALGANIGAKLRFHSRPHVTTKSFTFA